MKSLLEIRAVVHVARSIRLFQRSLLGGAAFASLLATASVFGQGGYYPVNPAGAPYGSTYNLLTIQSNLNLSALQNRLQALYGTTVTLQVPVPMNDSPPTTLQYTATVTSVVTDIENGVDAGAGITLASLSNEAIAWNLAARQSTTTAIAQAIIQVQYTNNGNSTAAINDLTTVANALAISQPTNIDSIVPNLLAQAETSLALAQGIPQIVVAAIQNIPTDLTRIASITNAGLAAIGASNQNASQKMVLFVGGSGYIEQLLNSTAANGNPTVIQTISQAITFSGYLSLASLKQIVQSEVVALPATTNNTLAAVTLGALASQGSSQSANIATWIQQAGLTMPQQNYVGAVVGGYTNAAAGSGAGSFQAYVVANPTLADAATAGAVLKGSQTGANVLTTALTYGTGNGTGVGATLPSNIVAEAILANVNGATSTITGAINPSTHAPYGYQSGSGETIQDAFGQIALGAAQGTPIQNIGNTVVTLINASGSLSALNTNVINSIVSNEIDGANSSGNAGAYGDIVYKAETSARNTTGASGPMVTAAINEINADHGLPYIAPIAAAAGDIYTVNRTAIQAAANADLTGGFKTAADQGLALVQAIQSSSTQIYTNVLNAMNTASTTSADAVRADVYAAIMADSTDYDADLATALKQTQTSASPIVSDTTLTTDAINALRGINASLTQNLQEVDAVVTHLQSEAQGIGPSGIGDIFGYVSQQIVINPSLVKDIVIAATVTDPDHAHFVATAAAFQAPTTVSGSVAAIFTYAQITNNTPGVGPLALTNATNANGALPTGKTFPGTMGAIVDQPAAAAAITAGLTTGILEANLSQPNTQSALSSTIAAAVAASLSQNGTALLGPTNPFNNSGDTAKQFQQSNGTAWNGATPSTGARTVGAAGAITGYIAEVTTSGQTTITATTIAVLQAAVGGGARPYALQMAQAAGQAFAWVAQFSGTPDTTTASNTNPVYAIAEAMAATVTGFATLPQLENAVAFGISQAENNVIGAGALGLNAGTGVIGITPGSGSLNAGNGSLVVGAGNNPNSAFYLHRSATGTPVTDIFNL